MEMKLYWIAKIKIPKINKLSEFANNRYFIKNCEYSKYSYFIKNSDPRQ